MNDKTKNKIIDFFNSGSTANFIVENVNSKKNLLESSGDFCRWLEINDGLENMSLVFSELKHFLIANNKTDKFNEDINSFIKKGKYKRNAINIFSKKNCYINKLITTDRISKMNFIESNDWVSVTFISDINQYKYAITNAIMLFKQSNNKKIKVNLVLVDLEDKKSQIGSIINGYNIKTYFIAGSSYKNFSSKIEHISNSTYIRLMLPNIVDDISTLYLDNDVVIRGDLSEALQIFDKTKAYARRWSDFNSYLPILNIYNKNLSIHREAYYNAGVIHLPLQEMRKNNFTKKVISYYEKQKSKIKFADQDILNSLLTIEDLPWNLNVCRDSWPKEYENLLKEVKIYHFISRKKQWFELENKNFKPKKGDLNSNEFSMLYPHSKVWLKFYNEIWKENY